MFKHHLKILIIVSYASKLFTLSPSVSPPVSPNFSSYYFAVEFFLWMGHIVIFRWVIGSVSAVSMITISLSLVLTADPCSKLQVIISTADVLMSPSKSSVT